MKFAIVFLITLIYANYEVLARFGKCPEIENHNSFNMSRASINVL